MQHTTHLDSGSGPGYHGLLGALLISLALSIGTVCRAQNTGETAAGPLLQLVPQLRTLAAPDWIRAGTQIIYYSAVASIRGSNKLFEQMPNGDWIDPKTGRLYGEYEVPTFSGHGFTQINVVALEANAAVLETDSYGIDTANGNALRAFGGNGAVQPPASGSDWWVNPQALARLGELNRPGVRIARLPYPLQGKVHPAIRLQFMNDRGFQQWTYDRDSGVLIRQGSSTRGQSSPFIAEGEHTPRAGSTLLTQNTLQAIRQTDYPWNGAPVPDWVHHLHSLYFRGVMTQRVAYAGSVRWPAQAQVDILHRGATWADYRVTLSYQPGMGMPAQHSTAVRASGNAGFGGLWLAPAVLVQLQPGQLIDQNPVTGIRIVVGQRLATGTGDQAISLVRQLPGGDTQAFVYDLTSGMLVDESQTTRTPVGATMTELTLTGTE